MALGFFRKRQKLIFIIMVALMVSFLIGYQGLSMLLQKNTGKQEYGKTSDYKVTFGMLKGARFDLELLRMMVPGFGERSGQALAYQMMVMGAAREDNLPLSYMLLLKQAGQDGFDVSPAEVDRLIKAMKSNGFPYDSIATDLRQNRGRPEKSIREVLGHWLMIFKAYRASIMSFPPSREELVRLFRDVTEQINLQVVKIPAESFLEKVNLPSEEQIREQFERYKNRAPGAFSGVNEFSFGYLYPAKVKLAYLFVDRAAIERGAAPNFEKVQDYYNEHRAELVKEPTLGETEKNGEKKDDKPVSVKVELMSFPEARPEITKLLKSQDAQAKFQDTIDRVQGMVRNFEPPKDPSAAEGKVFEEIVKKLTLPADNLLNRRIPLVAIEKLPLKEAIPKLADSVSPKLSAICFPWGEHGEINISPETKVTLVGRDMTVEDALEKIGAQIPNLPKLRWGCFEGIDNCIFPVEGIRFFPITAGRTGLESQEELIENALISKCFSPMLDKSLLQRAMQVDPIVPQSKFKIGMDEPIMTVWRDGDSGQLLWRVIDARAPKSPETITEAIRKKVINDWKLAQGFKLARRQAEKIKSADDLKKYAEKHKNETLESGMFSRRVHFAYGRGYFQPARVSKMEFINLFVDSHFIHEAFAALAPKDLDASYPKESQKVIVAPLACEGYVAVGRRINYLPAMEEDFELEKRNLTAYLERNQYYRARREWFSLSGIKERTKFKISTEK